MIGFESAISSTVDRVFTAAGVAAVHTDRYGVTTPCTVVIERNLSQYGATAQVNVGTVVLAVRLSELHAAPRRGDTFAVGATTYTVDSLQGSDTIEHKVFAA